MQSKVQDIQLNNTRKANIVYFSATGNTLKIVKEAEQFLHSTGYEVIVNSFGSNFIPSFKDTALLIIFFPVVYGTTYRFIFNNLLKLPEAKSLKTITACTYGGYAPGLMETVNGILSSKGYYILQSHKLKTASIFKKQDISEDDLRLVDECSRFLCNSLQEVVSIRYTVSSKDSCSDSEYSEDIELWENLHKSISIDIDRDKCIKCGKCIELCPTASIENRSFNINFQGCDLCFRCFLYCPVNAFSIKGLDIFRNTLFTGNEINYSYGYTNEDKKEAKQSKKETQKITI